MTARQRAIKILLEGQKQKVIFKTKDSNYPKIVKTIIKRNLKQFKKLFTEMYLNDSLNYIAWDSIKNKQVKKSKNAVKKELNSILKNLTKEVK